MNEMKILHKQDLIESFKWKDKKGNFHSPKDMSTQHLFFTFRMIWNHTAPEDMRIEPYQRYSFDDFYTAEYIADAIRAISSELSKREDLKPYFKKCLDIIKGHLNIYFGTITIGG